MIEGIETGTAPARRKEDRAGAEEVCVIVGRLLKVRKGNVQAISYHRELPARVRAGERWQMSIWRCAVSRQIAAAACQVLSPSCSVRLEGVWERARARLGRNRRMRV